MKTFVPNCGWVDTGYLKQNALVVSLKNQDISDFRVTWNPDVVEVVFDPVAEAEPGPMPWQFCFTGSDARYTHMVAFGNPWNAIHEDAPGNPGHEAAENGAVANASTARPSRSC